MRLTGMLAGTGLGLLSLSACAPTVVWDRPETTPAQAAADDARCRLMGEGTNPDAGSSTIYTGKIGRDLALNFVAGVAHGIAQEGAVRRTHDLCMQANGYIPRVAGAPVPPPVVAAAPPPMAYGPSVAPVQMQTRSATLVPPGRTAAAPPTGEGRIVLFPVTIFNSYHPHWDVQVAD